MLIDTVSNFHHALNSIFFSLQTFDVFDEHGTFIWAYYYTLHIIGAQFMLNLVLGVLSGYVFIL